MEIFSIENLTFFYPESKKPTINQLNLNINQGDFIVMCGKSGCGKTTLLKHLKTALAPHGERTGSVLFKGELIDTIEQKEQTSRVGFVMQNPDSQIVTDKVWHELAFGLESLGYDSQDIRVRTAEMASYFGIESWFYKKTSDLSGGQKQLLNLAGIMAMQPEIIILDEPTSQLDPIVASDFLATIGKINKDLGITILLTEHRLEEAFIYADRIVVMDNGEIIADENPYKVADKLKNANSEMFDSMPTPVRIYHKVKSNLQCPISIKEGRKWLSESIKMCKVDKLDQPSCLVTNGTNNIELKDIWFKYDKKGNDVLRNLSLKVKEQSVHCILGGNGVGKSTTLSLIAKLIKPYSGKILVKNKDIAKYSDTELYRGVMGMLPQNPQLLFVENKVKLELLDMFSVKSQESQEVKDKIEKVTDLFVLNHYLDAHPYDLSGGEQQRLAFAKIMLLDPEIILLDEPTKGLDNSFKAVLGGLLTKLKKDGKTILMVSHDVEFCAKYADECSFLFQGELVSTMPPREFFSGNSFYTTAANKMSRHIFSNAVTAEDVIELYNANS